MCPPLKARGRQLWPASSPKCPRQEAICQDRTLCLRLSQGKKKKKTRIKKRKRIKKKVVIRFQLSAHRLPRGWIPSSACWNKHLQLLSSLCSLEVEISWAECSVSEITLTGLQLMSYTIYCWKTQAKSRLQQKCRSIRSSSHLKPFWRTLGIKAWVLS